MKVKHKYPPNYKEIVKHFPIVAKSTSVVFTYGKTLYTPQGHTISPDLMVHEETHKKQQKKMGKDAWWNKYFNDLDFRLSQEVEAYQNQYKYIKDHYGRQLRRKIFKKITRDLSGSLYGYIITNTKAAELIKGGLR